MEDCILDILARHAISTGETVMVGDRVRDELRIAKSMGMTTIQMLHGRFKNEPADNGHDKPDYKGKTHLPDTHDSPA